MTDRERYLQVIYRVAVLCLAFVAALDNARSAAFVISLFIVFMGGWAANFFIALKVKS